MLLIPPQALLRISEACSFKSCKEYTRHLFLMEAAGSGLPLVMLLQAEVAGGLPMIHLVRLSSSPSPAKRQLFLATVANGVSVN